MKFDMIKHKIVRKIAPVLLLLLVTAAFSAEKSLARQSDAADKLFAVATEEETVYVYHTANLGFINGFVVERRQSGGEWQQITEEPVYPANGGPEFEFMVDDQFPYLQEATGKETSQEVYLTLMTRRTLNSIATSVFPNVAEALGNLYVDENPVLNQEVEYRFIVVNSNRQPTGKILSGEFNLVPGRPSTPENVQATNQGRDVLVTWNYSDMDYTEDGVSRFIIYDGTGDNREAYTDPGILRIEGESEISHSISVDQLNRTYNFNVVAVDVTGQESDPSETFSLQVTDNIPPRQVTGVRSIRAENDLVELSWNVSVEPKTVGYNLYRTTAELDVFQTITEEPLDVLENVYRDSTVLGGNHYRYYITAVDDAGNESEPSNISSIIVEEFLPPEPVSNFQVSRLEGNRINLEWAPGETEDFNTYVLLRKKIHPASNEAFTQINRERIKAETFIDEGIGNELPEGVTFRYGVAVSGFSGLQSDTLFADIHIPLTTPPEPPVDLILRRGDGNLINIAWSASPSPTVTNYQVFRVSELSGDQTETTVENIERLEEPVLVGETGRGNRFLRDDTVENGFSYQYQVTAVDSAGNSSEPTLSDLIFNRSGSIPGTVRNLQARNMNDQIHLRWEEVSSPDLNTYHIYRGQIPTGRMELIGEVSPATVNWVDEEGEPGNWYLVRAVDTSGNLSQKIRPTQAVD